MRLKKRMKYMSWSVQADSDSFEQNMERWRNRVLATEAKGAKALLVKEDHRPGAQKMRCSISALLRA
jgi:hypothetical protein